MCVSTRISHKPSFTALYSLFLLVKIAYSLTIINHCWSQRSEVESPRPHPTFPPNQPPEVKVFIQPLGLHLSTSVGSRNSMILIVIYAKDPVSYCMPKIQRLVMIPSCVDAKEIGQIGHDKAGSSGYDDLSGRSEVGVPNCTTRVQSCFGRSIESRTAIPQ